MLLAVSVAASDQAGAGLFDRLAETFGGGSAVVQSDGPTLAQPAPLVVPAAQSEQTQQAEQPPVPVPDEGPAETESIELYPCVTYDDKDEAHPCGVPVVVSVPDPCSVKHPFYWLVGDAPPNYCATACGTCTTCCAKPQVYVMICVPPDCPVPAPRVTHNERHYTYDFGCYRVEVKLRRGAIEVEYDS
jgi:hypothetical protein